jgi:hypothetical protein
LSVFDKSQLAGSSISAAADNSSEDNKHDNVDVPDSEMVEVAFMTDVPDNEVTQRQRLAFNVQAFGYNAISDIFPTPPKSRTQFTNEKYSETLDILRQIQSGDVDAKKKVLKASKLNYNKAQQFELQEIHLTNGNNKTLLCRKPELVKPLLWGPRGNIVLPMRQMFDVLYSAHERVGHMKVVLRYKNLQKLFGMSCLLKAKHFVHSVPIVRCNLQKLYLYKVPHVLSVPLIFEIDSRLTLLI